MTPDGWRADAGSMPVDVWADESGRRASAANTIDGIASTWRVGYP